MELVLDWRLSGASVVMKVMSILFLLYLIGLLVYWLLIGFAELMELFVRAGLLVR